MLNKSLAFGLLTAGLMIAPTAAFAGGSYQSQDNVQTTEQNGAATNGSVNAQDSNSVNIQRQNSRVGNGYNPYYYGGHRGNGHTSQSQRNRQDTLQNGAADNGSTNGQTSNSVNRQSQGVRRGW